MLGAAKGAAYSETRMPMELMKPATHFPLLLFASAWLACCAGSMSGIEPKRFDISEHGAIGDGKTLNTNAIQAGIDQCAKSGGGTLVVPKGEFVSGALFLKPGVNF